MTTPTYLALDLETTGLNPAYDRILEVAIEILSPDLVSLSAWATVVQAPGKPVATMHRIPAAMHAQTGLLTEPGIPLHQVEDTLHAVLDIFPERAILLGSSVHFDRSFLEHWMPHVSERLSHRHLDVSALAMLRPSIRDIPREGVEHRAAPDIAHSIAQARAFLVTP